MIILLAGGIYDGRRVEVDPEVIDIRIFVPADQPGIIGPIVGSIFGQRQDYIVGRIFGQRQDYALYRRPNTNARVAFIEQKA